MTETRLQVALMETLALTPLKNVISGSVTVNDYTEDKVAVTWGGVAIIPRVQLDAVRRTVDAERLAADVENTKEDT